MAATRRFDKEEVKARAHGHWHRLFALAGIGDEYIHSDKEGPCPKCGGKGRWRVYDDFEATGGARCNNCLEKGGSDGIGVMEWFLNLAFVDALAWVAEQIGVEPTAARPRSSPKSKSKIKASEPSEKIAPVDTRDEAYRTILAALPLSDQHRQQLRARGLTDNTIAAGMYRTLPEGFMLSAARFGLGNLLKLKPLLDGVPGIVGLRLAATPGLLFPALDDHGRIVALRSRPDKVEDGNKYRWVSSKKSGPSCGAPAHVPPGIGESDVIRITEGEIKAHVAYVLSGVPTLSFAGVENWRNVVPFVAQLLNPATKRVRFAFDYDAVNNKRVAACLLEAAEFFSGDGYNVEYERWPGDFGKGIDDVLAGGHGDVIEVLTGNEALQAIRELAQKAGVDEPLSLDDLSLLDTRTWTDTSNAKRFVKLHGENVRWIKPWGKWLWWNGQRWAVDDTHRVEHWAKDVAVSLFEEIASLANELSSEATEAAYRFARTTANERGIRNLLTLARGEAGIAVSPSIFDQHPMLLNCANGTVDLRTGQLLPHDRSHNLTKMAPVDFDPDASSFLWDQFIERIFDGNQPLIDYMQRSAGYWLTGDVSEQLMHIAWGGGANGKSTFIGTILAMMGDYASKASDDLLVESTGDKHPTEKADLFGRRFVACVESGEGKRLAETVVKELTGGDAVRARRMREDFWEFLPTHKLLLATNHKPRVRGTDKGIWRRLKLVPFGVTIPDEEKDPLLPQKLLGELSGVLAWAVRGCLEWQRDGLREPVEVAGATSEYRAAEDVLAKFLNEHCVLAARETSRAKDVRRQYEEWCEDNGEKPVSGRRFWEYLENLGVQKYTSNGTCYLGLGLLNSY